MTAADKIKAARALIEPLRATVLWQNANPNVMKAADLLAALADLADAQAQEIERLRKVLGFYANPENWKGDEEAWERAENGDDDPETLEALLSAVELDGGKIARAALGETP